MILVQSDLQSASYICSPVTCLSKVLLYVKMLLSIVLKNIDGAGPAYECLQQLETAMREALTTLGKLPQQADADEMAARLQSSLGRASAMQASLHATLESSSAGR